MVHSERILKYMYELMNSSTTKIYMKKCLTMLRLFRFLKNVNFNESGFNSVLIPLCEWGSPRI